MRIWCVSALGAASLLWGCGPETDTPPQDPALEAGFASSTYPNAMDNTAPNATVSQEETGGPTLTPAQLNAVRSAEQYLSMTGFSRNGLIEQLSSDAGDGYSRADAEAAVDSLTVDWNENAAKSARQYLDMTGFSCKGLIEQLSSSSGDKYTVEQATYGAQQAGAC